MPLFDFSCKKCGHVFEALVRKTTVPKCPECGATELEKLLSLPAIKSDSTHDKAMRAAKARGQKQATERNWTQRQYELHHDD